jgi:hypothetical protein
MDFKLLEAVAVAVEGQEVMVKVETVDQVL